MPSWICRFPANCRSTSLQGRRVWSHMRIVLLSVDDEFAGEMQRFLYARHPEWIVGSVISTRMIYKYSKLGALLFVLRKSGLVFLASMAYIKTLSHFLPKKQR